ncbi:MAG: thiol reductant ABC exporter subunit CydC [Hyphomicrobiaceae bacterium]
MREIIRLLGMFRPYWGWMFVAAALALATVLANVALLAVSGWFIAAMGIAGLAGATMNYFTPAAIIRALAITRTAGRYGERIVGHEATLRLVTGLRLWLLRRLEPLAPAGLGGTRSAEVMSRLRGDVERLEQIFLRILLPVTVGLLGTLACLAVLVWLHPWVGLAVSLLAIAAGIGVPVLIMRAAEPTGRQLAQSGSALNSALADGISGMAELEAYGATDAVLARIDGRSREVIDTSQRLARLGACGTATILLGANLGIVAAVVLAAPDLRGGLIGGADFVLLVFLAWALFEAMAAHPAAAQSVGAALASARRVFSLADQPPSITEPAHPVPLGDARGLAFSGVGLTYPGATRAALAGVDIALEAAKHVGILGASGSGKSTLVQLATRLIAPSDGVVTLGGTDTMQLAGFDIRGAIAVAPQHVHLFTGTIADNLLLAKPDANRDEIEHACRLAQIHDFITGEPDGYDTYVGAAGLKLSGGQARRLGVARALLRDASILLLDEPTEGLDDATATAMITAIQRHFRDRSVMIIEHRQSVLTDVDELVVLDRGRVTFRGVPSHFRRPSDDTVLPVTLPRPGTAHPA